MKRKWILSLLSVLGLFFVLGPKPAFAQSDLQKVKHIIVVMQENRSFDNYFGALPYVPGGVYHGPNRFDRDRDWDDDREANGGCRKGDHRCVDGLSCFPDASGTLHCFNSNIDDNGHLVFAFHDPKRCVVPDLDHGWVGAHKEANFNEPNDSLHDFRANGFVLVNDTTEQIDKGNESPTEDETMGFYTQADLPFYYDIAQKFAIDDRYFSSVLGPTFPNRSYFMAATSFGHLTTNDIVPPTGGYRPIHGTIFDLLDAHGVSWADYFQDVPQGASFRPFSLTGADPHFLPYKLFLAQAAGVPAAGPLPEVSFVDPNFGFFTPATETDEHPPTDIQRGQAFLSQVINTVRNGPNWKDSIIFITYDEAGGFYDHVRPPQAPQGGQSTPDGIAPGQCADASNVPTSLQPGKGAQCSTNQINPAGNSVKTAEDLCPQLVNDPTGPFPVRCASFGQLGYRVPLMAISPFSKPHYVSHTIGDHTSLLALIEKRFISSSDSADDDDDRDGDDSQRPHLTKRDQHANTLEDLFDFDHSPSLNTTVGTALPPANDCTPK